MKLQKYKNSVYKGVPIDNISLGNNHNEPMVILWDKEGNILVQENIIGTFEDLLDCSADYLLCEIQHLVNLDIQK
jgi:hypothetical protein